MTLNSPIYTIEEAQKCAFLGEHWEYVPDFCRVLSDQYLVSNYGRVLNIKTGNILQPCTNSSGYSLVSVTRKDGSRGTETVHSLVAITFIGERPKGAVIRHLNGIATDNRLTNLTYGSHSQNAHDALRQKKFSKQLDPETVTAIREMDELGFPHSMIAERIGCSDDSVYNVTSGRRWGWYDAD